MPREPLGIKLAKHLKRRFTELGKPFEETSSDINCRSVARFFRTSFSPASPENIHSVYRDINSVLAGEEHDRPDYLHLRRFAIGNVILHSVLRQQSLSLVQRDAIVDALSVSNFDASQLRGKGLTSEHLNSIYGQLCSFANSFKKKYIGRYPENRGAVADVNNSITSFAKLPLLAFRLTPQ